MVCPHGQRGLSQCRQGGSIFRDFVRMSFVDGSLLKIDYFIFSIIFKQAFIATLQSNLLYIMCFQFIC